MYVVHPHSHAHGHLRQGHWLLPLNMTVLPRSPTLDTGPVMVRTARRSIQPVHACASQHRLPGRKRRHRVEDFFWRGKVLEYGWRNSMRDSLLRRLRVWLGTYPPGFGKAGGYPGVLGTGRAGKLNNINALAACYPHVTYTYPSAGLTQDMYPCLARVRSLPPRVRCVSDVVHQRTPRVRGAALGRIMRARQTGGAPQLALSQGLNH